ncbi:BAR-domain-containing protein, partial [Aureobasidium melanogenum]
RMKQWTDERMGKEIKTAASDEFKALELEMQLRHEGMERLQRSMTTYVKSLSKTKEAEDKEKTLPIAYLGSTMASHGDDFEPDSEFGQCLSALGRANERIARMQESYVSNATNSWLESIERSLAQMKEYQTARKRLETRRLAYDTSMNKLQRAKKDDFALEESARAQKAKYDESSDDVQRRMLDIKEAEVDSINDLSTF